MCVCVCVCVCVCMHMHVCTHAHVHMYDCMNVWCAFADMCLCVNLCSFYVDSCFGASVIVNMSPECSIVLSTEHIMELIGHKKNVWSLPVKLYCTALHCTV